MKTKTLFTHDWVEVIEVEFEHGDDPLEWARNPRVKK